MAKIPSPCIDVCAYKRGGHCRGCSMTRTQKAAFKTIKGGKAQSAFVTMIRQQQTFLGGYKEWEKAYAKKVRKKERAARNAQGLEKDGQ